MSWILARLIMLIGVILVPILLVLSRSKPAAIFPPQALGDKSEQPQQKNRRRLECSKGSIPDKGQYQTRIRRMTRRF
jgi:hypothetical protein